ncbi:FAD:protein FMN transferase [Actinoplanes sp. NBRC 103695]|uniref:FAD:protein FMN transferase n=1 Tax=Actinoplanes sp. NBRC 103695 TaxID=3032202 RepID=UPI0024A56655|nr:FAD:protein FMN transferase [Actinoplanes sp. NBRC 103695]GLY94083.1 FAD:protein FMN transferase [Actinoplanes sp. NBRC 103695]
MPLAETLPVGPDTAQWSVWGTVARIVVTDPALLAEAAMMVRAELSAVDAACSRFRPDSELSAACRAGGRPVTVSPLLADLLGAALEAARTSDGDVDPTVGAALCGLGYDRDFAAITGRTATSAVRVFPAPDWRAVRLDDRALTVPHGVLLDLGATAKAAAADRAAVLVADRLGTGVLVALGGDIATAGPAPAGGWRVLVQDRPGDPRCTVRLPGGAALATSSTVARAWGAPGDPLHHILDPRTGRPASRVWRTVSVAAPSCLRANTLSTAAVVRGHSAPRLLAGVPARLVTATGEILRLGRWPA